jgi:hypothetical protein
MYTPNIRLMCGLIKKGSTIKQNNLKSFVTISHSRDIQPFSTLALTWEIS